MTPGSQIRNFFSRYPVSLFAPREIILREEQEINHICFLDKGLVKQYYVSSSGDVFTPHIYKPGSVFPVTGIFQNQPNLYNFESLTPCTIYKAPVGAVENFFRSHPDIMLDLTVRLAHVLSLQSRLMETLVLGSAYARTAYIIHHLASNFGRSSPAGVSIDLHFTHREIAGLSGITRESASIQMRNLQASGLIRCRCRRISVVDMDRLLEESQP